MSENFIEKIPGIITILILFGGMIYLIIATRPDFGEES
jgi:hypothetical protein